MKTLAEPTLTAVSGEKATFQVGGEFNSSRSSVQRAIRPGQTNQTQRTFDKLDYGIGLEFQPVVLSPGRISLKVRTSVSEPTYEAIRSALPACRERSLQLGGHDGAFDSQAARRHDDRAALRRLDDDCRPGARRRAAGDQRLARPVQDPGARGTCSAAADFVRNETELVIIVTPYLARPVARNAARQAGRQFQRAERRRRDVPRPRQPRLRNHADGPCRTAAITASSASSTNDGTGLNGFHR